MNRPRTSTGRRLKLGLAITAIALLLPVAWYLGSPLFINTPVDEGFPSRAMPADTQPVDRPAAAPSEALPPPVRPRVLTSGRFGEIDAIHKGEGAATIFTLADGQHVLRLEEFKATNGPDLYVYLSAHPAPRDSRQLHDVAAFEVARLKGNIGSQNYELPADLDLSRFKSVVIYCRQFSVVFSTAELAAG